MKAGIAAWSLCWICALAPAQACWGQGGQRLVVGWGLFLNQLPLTCFNF